MAGAEATTMDIFQEDTVQDGGIDPAYEFCAPQFFDFSKPDDDLDQEAMQVDTWFDMKTVPDEISRELSLCFHSTCLASCRDRNDGVIAETHVVCQGQVVEQNDSLI